MQRLVVVMVAEIAGHMAVCVNRWSELKEIAERKKEGLQLAHDVNTFHIECQETAV